MTSKLRPAVEVWDDAIAAWAADTIDTRQAAEIARLSEALAAIADGEGDAQDIARQTLAGEEDQ